MALLRIEYSDGRKRDVPVDKPELILGRDASCDVTLVDALTSRRHLRLYADGRGDYWVQDLNSKNGICLNERPVTTARLSAGDRITAGTSTIIFCKESETQVVLRDAERTPNMGNTSAWAVDQRLELSRKRLETLYELNERLTGRFERDDLLGELLEICVEHLRLERAGIAIWTAGSKHLQWIRMKNFLPGASGELTISRSVVDRAVENAERILILDTADGKVDPTASMISANIRSAMCVPMEYHQEVRGVIYGDRTSSVGNYTREDLDFFAAIGRLGAMGLANIQLVEEMKNRHYVESQLHVARQIQARLFPEKPIETPTLVIDALNDPGQKVSGDYFDYFTRDDGLVTVVIADVAGKGIPASLMMANLQAAVQVILAKETDLPKAVQAINALVHRNLAESRFITGMFGLLDTAARKLTYVNAGHVLPYLIRCDQKVEEVSLVPEFPLGVVEGFEYTTGVIEMPDKPCTLFLHTDGVCDAEAESGEMYGAERLDAALQSSAAQPPRELITRIRRSIKQFTRSHPQTDDITMVAIRLP